MEQSEQTPSFPQEIICSSKEGPQSRLYFSGLGMDSCSCQGIVTGNISVKPAKHLLPHPSGSFRSHRVKCEFSALIYRHEAR